MKKGHSIKDLNEYDEDADNKAWIKFRKLPSKGSSNTDDLSSSPRSPREMIMTSSAVVAGSLPLSPSKRKRASEDKKTSLFGRKAVFLKWSDAEDDIIKEAIIKKGEDGIDWYEVLRIINLERGKMEPRSKGSVTMHWKQTLKPKMLNMSLSTSSQAS